MPAGLAIAWGCFAVVIGSCLVIFRRWAAARIAARRERWGRPTGLITQSPVWLASGGAFFVVVGLGVIVAAATGVLPAR